MVTWGPDSGSHVFLDSEFDLMSEAHLSAAAALIAHLESAASDQRVLLVGRSDTSFPEAILARGARIVHVLDADSRRVSDSAARNKNPRISYAQLTDSALRDGSYGLSIVEDLAQLEAPRTVCEKIAKTIRPSGLVAIAATAQEGDHGLLGTDGQALDYAELTAWAEENFEAVRTLGQSPFVGYSVVHFDLENAPEPSLDNGFIEQGDEAEFYVALCGSQEAVAALEVEDMTIVQLQGRQVLDERRGSDEARTKRDRRQIHDLQAELAARSAGRHADSEKLVAEIETRDEKLFELKKQLVVQKRRGDDAEAELDRIEAELSEAAEASPDALHEQQELTVRLEESERATARGKKEAQWAEERVRKLEKELEQVLQDAETRWSEAPAADDSEDELIELRTEKQSLEQERSALLKKLELLTSQSKDSQGQLERAQLEVTSIEKRSRRAQLDYDQTQAKLVEQQSASRDAQKEIDELVSSVDSLNQKLHDTEEDADHFYALAKQRKVKLESLSAKLEKSKHSAKKKGSDKALDNPAQASEIDSLEKQLKERGVALRTSQQELEQLQSYCQGLIAQQTLLEAPQETDSSKAVTHSSSGDSETSREQLQELGDTLAKKEADLVAARWTIGQLRQEVVKS